MIRVNGLEFDESVEIKNDMILRCHPQLVPLEEERYGVPLRATSGYQCIYDNLYREFKGLIFYAPPYIPAIRKIDEEIDPMGSPHDTLKYVLASFDGTLKPYKNGVCLIANGITFVYDNLNILKSSGSVKKGAIIGTVKKVETGLGYGVSIIAYKGGKVWNIQNELFNINCVE